MRSAICWALLLPAATTLAEEFDVLKKFNPFEGLEYVDYDPDFHPGEAFKYSPKVGPPRRTRFRKQDRPCEETVKCYSAPFNPRGWLMNPHTNSSGHRFRNTMSEYYLEGLNTSSSNLEWNEPGYKPKIGKTLQVDGKAERTTVRMRSEMMEASDVGQYVVERLGELAMEADAKEGWNLLKGRWAKTREEREALGLSARYQIAHHSYPAGSGLLNLQHYDEGALVTIILMLSHAEEYDGGETVMVNDDGTRAGATHHRLERGDALAFAGNRYHGVAEVTRGIRRCVILEISDEEPQHETAEALRRVHWIREATAGLTRFTIPPEDELSWGYSRNQHGAGSQYVSMDEYTASLMVIQSGKTCVRTAPCQRKHDDWDALSHMHGHDSSVSIESLVDFENDEEHDILYIPIIYEQSMLKWLTKWLRTYYPESIAPAPSEEDANATGYVPCQVTPRKHQPYRVFGTPDGISTALLTADQVGGYVTRFGRPGAERAVQVLARYTGCTSPLARDITEIRRAAASRAAAAAAAAAATGVGAAGEEGLGGIEAAAAKAGVDAGFASKEEL